MPHPHTNPQSNSYHGWISIHKPLGMTSFDVVRDVKRILRPLLPKKTKIGHGGTLDPLASGVLPIAIGEATKTVDYLMDEKKTYVFDVTWGIQTITDDAENLNDPSKEVILHQSPKRPTQSEIEDCIPSFLGELEQFPPLYSAKKIQGERACDRMRRGESIDLPASTITVFSLEMLSHQENVTRFKVVCSKGTYIRSIARDMGQKLGCYGHASKIERTKVGHMAIETALPTKNLAILENPDILRRQIQPIQTVLADIPAVLVTPDQEARLRHGQVVVEQTAPKTASIVLCVAKESLDETTEPNHETNFAERAVAIAEVGVEVGINEDSHTTLKPKRIFNIFN